ncbi:MAG: xanthine dehydrogenase family protein subunit M [Nocardiopsaceae bacterium]|jgi:CO/xanthine dehydrogenase FAD-binding subunit|nr:xanthine dehydrogenase family protein subunit M [Nocardiopsaceae bacterium]
MVAPAFEYAAAGSYDEAVRLLADGGDEAKVLAGGQSLMPMLNLRLARPELLIDINAADDRQPTVADGMLRLPALTRHRILVEHDLMRKHCPVLADAARHVGNVRVRNRGTLGGSLAHADPTSEIGCCALVTGGHVVVRGPDGDRTVPASDLFDGYWTTTLAASEIITDVLIPVGRPRQGWSFQEMVRRTSDFAIVAVAAIVELHERADTIAAARVALAGVADRVTLAGQKPLAGLVGSDCDETAAEAAAARISGSLEPPDDVHASGDYRRRLVRVLTARALREAYARATGAPA